MPLAHLIHMLLIGESPWFLKLGSQITEFFSGYGGVAVLLLAIADSSFLSFPEGNDLLIVILSTGGSWSNMAYFVCLTVTGSVIGCLLLYTVGRKGGRAILKKKFSVQKIERERNDDDDDYKPGGINSERFTPTASFQDICPERRGFRHVSIQFPYGGCRWQKYPVLLVGNSGRSLRRIGKDIPSGEYKRGGYCAFDGSCVDNYWHGCFPNP